MTVFFLNGSKGKECDDDDDLADSLHSIVDVMTTLDLGGSISWILTRTPYRYIVFIFTELPVSGLQFGLVLDATSRVLNRQPFDGAQVYGVRNTFSETVAYMERKWVEDGGVGEQSFLANY